MAHAIENIDEVLKELTMMTESGRTAMDYTMRDVGKRAPSWVAQEATKVYNVKKSDVLRGNGLSISVQHDEEGVALKYTGIRLSPRHYGLKPTSHRRGDYVVTQEVVRGSRKQIGQYSKKKKKNGPHSKHSGNFLMLQGGTTVAARVSPNRNDVKAFKGPAVPELVSSERLEPLLTNRLSEEASKRLEHQLERAFK